jgi:hypothetical protein
LNRKIKFNEKLRFKNRSQINHFGKVSGQDMNLMFTQKMKEEDGEEREKQIDRHTYREIQK